MIQCPEYVYIRSRVAVRGLRNGKPSSSTVRIVSFCGVRSEETMTESCRRPKTMALALLLCISTSYALRVSRVPRLRSTVIDVDVSESAEDAAAAVAAAAVDAAKASLLDAISGTERGFKRDRTKTDVVRAAISTLAAAATEDPTRLDGDWTLAWTDAPDIISLNGGLLSTLGRIGQEINAADGTIVNVIEWSPSPLAIAVRKEIADDVVEQRVVCSFVESSPGDVKLTLKGAGVKPRRVFERDLDVGPFEAIGPLSLPFGDFRVLFNDGDLRVVKTGQGYFSVNMRKTL